MSSSMNEEFRFSIPSTIFEIKTTTLVCIVVQTLEPGDDEVFDHKRWAQIYRALRPAPSSEACSAMLSCLVKCVTSPAQVPLEMAVDIILTLQVIHFSRPFCTQLVIFPCPLLWYASSPSFVPTF